MKPLRCPTCFLAACAQDQILRAIRPRVEALHRKAHRAFERQEPIPAVEVYEVTVWIRELLAEAPR